jgi:hypothetical protein
MNKINVGQMMHTMNTLNPNWRGPQYVVAIYAGASGEHYLTAVDANGAPTSYQQIDDNKIKDVSSGAEYFDLMVMNPTVVTNPAQINAALQAIQATAQTQSVATAHVPFTQATTPAPTPSIPTWTLEDVVDEVLTNLVTDEQLFTAFDVTLKVRAYPGFSGAVHWEVRLLVRGWMNNNMSSWDYKTSSITLSNGSPALLYRPEDADPSDYKLNIDVGADSTSVSPTVPTVPTAASKSQATKFEMVDRQNDRVRIPKSIVSAAGYSSGDILAIEVVINGLVILPFKPNTSAQTLVVTNDGRINVTNFWLNKAGLTSSVANVRVTVNHVTQENMIEIWD